MTQIEQHAATENVKQSADSEAAAQTQQNLYADAYQKPLPADCPSNSSIDSAGHPALSHSDVPGFAIAKHTPFVPDDCLGKDTLQVPSAATLPEQSTAHHTPFIPFAIQPKDEK